jgi:hypothetical protein
MHRSVAFCIFAFVLGAATVAMAQSKAAPRSAASLECSRQADEKGLHGKARKKFRSKCLRAAKRRGN